MSSIRKILDLSVLAGETLIRNGGEIFRVQDTITVIAKAYNVPKFNICVLSNALFVSMGDNDETLYTEIKNIPLSPIHLGRVAAVNNLSRGIAKGKYTVDEAIEALHTIENIPYSSDKLKIICASIGSGCFCNLLGGNFYDCLASFFAVIILFLFITFVPGKNTPKIIVNIMGSFIVSLCGVLIYKLGLGSNSNTIIIGSIIPLLPGVALTTSIRDFLNEDYLSGTVRLIDALLIALSIALGVGLTIKIITLLNGGLLQ